MEHYYWNDWYMGWGWFLWYGLIFLLFSSVGNWGYTYSAHRKSGVPKKEVLDILNERYARGEIVRDEFNRMKSDIFEVNKDSERKSAMSSQQSPA